MSKIADAIIGFWEMYEKAEREFDYWESLLKYEYTEDNALAAAQYYGKMNAIADISYELFGDEILREHFAKKDVKLFRSDFAKEKGS